MTRIRNSWALFKSSFEVLMGNKKLLLFPLVNLVALIGILGFFCASLLTVPVAQSLHAGAGGKERFMSRIFTTESLDRTAAVRAEANKSNDRLARREANEGLEFNRPIVLIFAAVYFFSMFIATFLNVAFYQQIMEALKGQAVSLRAGVAFAMTKLPAILAWTFFAGAVGYLIRALEQKLGIFGRIVVRLVGVAWSVAAVFAIPVIICEETVNPVQVLKNSAATFKKAWGEAVVAYVGFEGLGLAVILASALPVIALAILVTQLNMPGMIFMLIAGWLGFVVLFAYVAGVAGNVYQCALYAFASSGRVPGAFTPEMMQMGWKKK